MGELSSLSVTASMLAANALFRGIIRCWAASMMRCKSEALGLWCGNGEIIAASQGYETKANAEKDIEAIKTHAPNAKVEDHSDAKSSSRVAYSTSVCPGGPGSGLRRLLLSQSKATPPTMIATTACSILIDR